MIWLCGLPLRIWKRLRPILEDRSPRRFQRPPRVGSCDVFLALDLNMQLELGVVHITVGLPSTPQPKRAERRSCDSSLPLR